MDVLVVNWKAVANFTSGDFDYECYLDFYLVLDVKLNIFTKFVLQYMYNTSFPGGITIDIKLE